MAWLDPVFNRLMSAYGITGKVLKYGRVREKLGHKVDIVFSDRMAIYAMHLSYWDSWMCPHVFYCEPNFRRVFV